MAIGLNPATILSGQGLDVASLVQQIIASHSGQLNVWQAQQTTLATQDGLLAGMNNNPTKPQTAVAPPASPTRTAHAPTAASSQPAALTAPAHNHALFGH